MSSDNPTEEYDETNGDIKERDFNEEKEVFIRNYIARQRELHRKSLTAVANLASANAEMILMAGLNEAAAKRTSSITKDTKNEIIDDMLSHQTLTKHIEQERDNKMMVERLRQALNPNVE